MEAGADKYLFSAISLSVFSHIGRNIVGIIIAKAQATPGSDPQFSAHYINLLNIDLIM